MRSSRRHPRGYVLVVTLGLLVLSTTLLVAVGRMAVRHSLDARTAARDLQRRWGTISCRDAILPFADRVLGNAEAKLRRPVPVYRTSILLGTQRFDLVISDEQAKANINTLIESSDRTVAENRLRASLSGSGLTNAVRLRVWPLISKLPARATSQPTTRSAGVPRWISGFGQIFDDVPPQRLFPATGSAAADRVTCWGGGAINVMRASEPALRLATTPALSQIDIDRLLDARNSTFGQGRAPENSAATDGGDALGSLLSQAKINGRGRAKISATTLSACHSIWIVVKDARRDWYYLDVSDETDPDHPQYQSFVW